MKFTPENLSLPINRTQISTILHKNPDIFIRNTGFKNTVIEAISAGSKAAMQIGVRNIFAIGENNEPSPKNITEKGNIPNDTNKI